MAHYDLPIPTRPADGEFWCFEAWVNKATSWIAGENALCVDAQNRICYCGGDFMRARDEKTFPVRFYLGAGGERPEQNKHSRRLAAKALRLHYPWRRTRT